MSQVQVTAEQQSDVSLQGDIIRNRVPAGITQAVGGEVGDAINWQVLTNGSQTWIQGVVVKGGARGRQGNLPKRTAAAKPTALKVSKKGAKKGKAGTSFDDAFAAPTPQAPQKPAVAVIPVAPVAAKGKKGGASKSGYQVPPQMRR